MKPGIPWSIKGIESETREVAKAAAHRSGMTLGQWMNDMIQHGAQVQEARQVSYQAPMRETGRKPAKRHKKHKKSTARKITRIDNRLAELADQLMALSEQSQATAVNRFIGHEDEPAVGQALDAMIRRIERGETQTRESFETVNARLDSIDEKLSTYDEDNQDPSKEFQALETALRNIVDHVETSEKRNRETLNNMQERMSEMSKRAEQAESSDVSVNAPAIAALDARIAELAALHEQATNASKDETRSYLEERLASIGEQIDAVRHSSDAMTKRAETSAVDAAKKEAREVENRVADLIGEARSLIVKATAPGNALNSIRGEIESLNQRFDDIKAESASDQDVQSLKLAIEQLTANVASGQDMQPVAQMEQRLADLTHRLDQTSTADHMAPQLAELEQRITALDQQLSVAMGKQGDSQAYSALESQIAMIGERMSATEQKLGSLTTIEQSISQLYNAIEDNKAEARNVAEKTVSRMVSEFTPQSGSAGNGPSPELIALEEGLAAVKQSSLDAEQHNQETLEAVHETLEQIISKLTEMESRDVVAPQPDREEQEDQNNDWQAAVQSHLQESLTSQADQSPADDESQDLQQPDISSAFDPGPVPQDPQQQPTPASGQTEALRATSSVQQPSQDKTSTAEFEREVFESESPVEPEAAPLDYIAQARLASQTASTQPKSPIASKAGLIAEKIMPGKKQDDLTGNANGMETGEVKKKSSLFSLPFLSKKSSPDKISKPVAEKSADKDDQKGSRKRLLMAGLILLIAASSFAYNKFSAGPDGKSAPTASLSEKSEKPATPSGELPAPEKSSQATPDAQELVPPVSLAAPRPPGQAGHTASTPEQTGMPPANALQTGNENIDQVSSVPVDPITTSALPPAPKLTADTFEEQTAELLPEAVGTTELRQAAINGDASAQFVVASRYVEGKQVKRDYAKAALWYQKAASTGLAPAQYRLGTLFERGNGVPKDANAARLWYERAAENGNVKAMHNLAVIYASPRDGLTNYAKARKWFEKAANYGLKDSQYNLAVIHERGLAGERSAKEAFYWYSLAAADGDRDAGLKASRLKARITNRDIRELEQRQAQWKPQKALKAGNFVAIKDPKWRVTARMNSVPKLNAKPNLNGSALIKQTQSMLSKLGFDIGKADGVMGSRTANAVRLFQLQNGLQVNGMVTNDLLQQLQARS